ncbi:hypothetical protein B0H13DRAFT_1917519 [Mycena leptocephala]|nr:hypothetical protein B0H13DRAFT_1917519 [Mycena leptocephala]
MTTQEQIQQAVDVDPGRRDHNDQCRKMELPGGEILYLGPKENHLTKVRSGLREDRHLEKRRESRRENQPGKDSLRENPVRSPGDGAQRTRHERDCNDLKHHKFTRRWENNEQGNQNEREPARIYIEETGQRKGEISLDYCHLQNLGRVESSRSEFQLNLLIRNPSPHSSWWPFGSKLGEKLTQAMSKAWNDSGSPASNCGLKPWEDSWEARLAGQVLVPAGIVGDWQSSTSPRDGRGAD